jgi:pentatricopeptide repeat protein
MRRTSTPARTAHQRILAAKKEGAWQDAVNSIAEMREAGHTLSTVSYNAAIDACGKAKQVGRALELFDELVAAGNVPDAVTYTALIDACGRAAMLDNSFALFAR